MRLLCHACLSEKDHKLRSTSNSNIVFLTTHIVSFHRLNVGNPPSNRNAKVWFSNYSPMFLFQDPSHSTSLSILEFDFCVVVQIPSAALPDAVMQLNWIKCHAFSTRRLSLEG